MTNPHGEPFSIWLVFLMGLGLNLTPCVYPMLSVTISLFSPKKDVPGGRLASFLKACVYVLGIAVMYSTLGVAAALTGEMFGSLLQSTVVLVGLAVLLFVLALSMFGIYTFQMPAWLLNRLANQKQANFLGIFVSGLCVGIFAAPCIGPPVIALLTYVSTLGDPVFGFRLFFIMSLGLGSPYLLLATFSGWMKKLPKSGVWLVWIEHAFGIILLALALFYLLSAFQPRWISHLPIFSFLAGGIYLGFLDRTGHLSKSFTQFKHASGIAAICVSIGLFMALPRQSLAWEVYDPSQLASAQANHQPVILDFYADWCIPCHELDRYTYSDENVMQALSSFKKLKIDLTRMGSPESVEMVERFNLVGVPTVIFLDAAGKEVPETRISGFVTPEELLEIISHIPAAESSAS
ncbi:MAG: cytochrome C biogenesis protein [Candidatus Omnitrophica bacterium CG11_big_fil_rev_8_21_14_0_20_45_26]|uniref:Cytochrome C biogenesis protein n=1 Tax=Candidatus Abzuiibacterium crystallinum TaxID=1974748 RepID=A0A2H0LNQ7_9BACT|nr:MAG: cytochrome C biogenesis protein [Candidatus Omnitrophica bacterium CG11_big_fil_rev_8_21_14_0_20_45_26]PIW65664.1 MAG: cytochrome C biogenesis protein [Candidatus Omnitrophica bacterium CG12_big_fil_rev_8_21_14_0_65_45_16]